MFKWLQNYLNERDDARAQERKRLVKLAREQADAFNDTLSSLRSLGVNTSLDVRSSYDKHRSYRSRGIGDFDFTIGDEYRKVS